MARPSKYNPELAERILRLLSEHGSLPKALAAAGDLPAAGTIYRWLVEKPEFREQYTRAREAGDEPVADEIERIAYDTALPSDQKRVMIDSLKWILARRTPKKWGDKVAHEVTGAGGGPVQYMVVTGVPEPEHGSED